MSCFLSFFEVYYSSSTFILGGILATRLITGKPVIVSGDIKLKSALYTNAEVSLKRVMQTLCKSVEVVVDRDAAIFEAEASYSPGLKAQLKDRLAGTEMIVSNEITVKPA